MFGYVMADKNSLTPEQLARWQGSYCGLCRSMGFRCGQLSRCALTYDLCFLSLLLGSLYEPEERELFRACPVHPFKEVHSIQSAATDYAADLNVLLARRSALDHWQDERKLRGLLLAKSLGPAAKKAAARLPEKEAAIQQCMETLGQVEARRDPSPDAGAGAFGRLTGELLVWREDRWSPTLRALGLELGRFIYLLDALCDLEQDEKKGLYNPLSAAMAGGMSRRDITDILLTLAASAADWMERLPLCRDIDILRNILYTGLWTKIKFTDGERTTNDSA